MRKSNIISIVIVILLTVGLLVAARIYFPPGASDVVMIVKRTVFAEGEKNNRLSYNFYINRNGQYFYANGYDFDKRYSRFGDVKDSQFEAFLNDEFFSWKYGKMIEGEYIGLLDTRSYLKTIATLDGDEEMIDITTDELRPGGMTVLYEIKVRDESDESFITIATFEKDGTSSFTGKVMKNPNVQKIAKGLLNKWPKPIGISDELEVITQSLEG